MTVLSPGEAEDQGQGGRHRDRGGGNHVLRVDFHLLNKMMRVVAPLPYIGTITRWRFDFEVTLHDVLSSHYRLA